MGILKKIILLFSVYAILAIAFQSAKRGVSFVQYNTDLPVIYTDEDLSKEVDKLLNAGRRFAYLGDFEKGNALMDSATLLKPYGRAFQQKAPINLLQGNYKKAFKALDESVERGYDYALGYRAWAKMHYLQDYTGAIKDFETYDALSEGPSYAFAMSVMMLKGIAKKELGDFGGAIKAFNTYIKEEAFEKLDVYVYLHRGLTYYKMGALDKALEDYESFLALYPNGPEAHYQKGIVLLEKDEKEAACKCFKDCLRLIRKGYTRGYIWNEIPDQLYRIEVEEKLKFCDS